VRPAQRSATACVPQEDSSTGAREHPNSAGIAPWPMPIPLLAVSHYALVALAGSEVGVRGQRGDQV
jgi:hypothetical protein